MTMPALTVIVLLYGVTDVFVDLAGSALVPDLVPRSRLEAANGRTLAAQQVMSAFVGGPVAGALLALGAGWVFGVPAGLGVLALLLIATRIPGSYKHAATAEALGRPPRSARASASSSGTPCSGRCSWPAA